MGSVGEVRLARGAFGVEPAAREHDELGASLEDGVATTWCRTARPARPSTSWPPAASTISGTQCPAANGGSDHSHTKISLRATPRDRRPHRSQPPLHLVDDRPSALGDPETHGELEHAGADLVDRVRVERDDLGLERARAGRRRRSTTAQTVHRSCVTTMSGASASICRSSSTYSESPVRSAARTPVVDRTSRESRRVDTRARHDGQRRAPPAASRTPPRRRRGSRRDRGRRRSRWRSGGASRCGCPCSCRVR